MERKKLYKYDRTRFETSCILSNSDWIHSFLQEEKFGPMLTDFTYVWIITLKSILFKKILARSNSLVNLHDSAPHFGACLPEIIVLLVLHSLV